MLNMILLTRNPSTLSPLGRFPFIPLRLIPNISQISHGCSFLGTLTLFDKYTDSLILNHRILNRGTRRELHILAHQQPSPFYKHARCLDGLSPTQVRRIIGPFSPEEITAFQRRFFPTRADRERLDARTRLANLVIPDTSQDFHPLIDPSPGNKIIFLSLLRLF